MSAVTDVTQQSQCMFPGDDGQCYRTDKRHSA